MMLSKQVTAFAAFVAYLDLAEAFWRLECDGSTRLARLDPLMSPGGISDHVHRIKGGGGKSSSGPWNTKGCTK